MNVVVTTKHRGVFFGSIAEMPGSDEQVLNVENIQMCVYWSADVKGVLGLASHGPGDGCRVARPVPGTTQLRDVTAVFPASDEASGRWAQCPW